MAKLINMPALVSAPEEVGSNHMYINKRMMSRLVNNIPLR